MGKLDSTQVTADLLGGALATMFRWADLCGHGLILYDNEGVIRQTTTNLAELLAGDDSLVGRPLAEVIEIVSADRVGSESQAVETVKVHFPDPLQISLLDGRVIRGEGYNLLDLSWTGQSQGPGDFLDGTSSSADFIGQIAHEIRNPLAAISTTIEILARFQEARGKEYCELLKEEVDRVVNLLKNLLELSNPAANTGGECRVIQVLMKCLGAYKAMAEKAGVRIKLVFAPGDVTVPISETRLNSVLENVISNALQAMESGGVLSLSGGLTPANVFDLRIADSGKGIDPLDLEEIFKPFFSRRCGGTGLGLALVRRFVDDAGGKIMVHSLVGEGTSVDLTLPVLVGVDQGDD